MAETRKRNTPNGASKSGAERPVQPRAKTASTGLPINSILALASVVAAGWLWYSGAFSRNAASSASTGSGSSTTPSQPSPVGASSVEKGDLTDAQLRAYDGSDPDKPIYLAINGTIFDVSSGRTFYGPGGHYGHFSGRDATRAWVTECWKTQDQLTHDMRGVEEMFMPKYIDEEFTDAVEGKGDVPDALREQAAPIVKRLGKVTDEERAKRRIEDTPEALDKVEEALLPWVKFFADSGKYAVVGKVLREEGWEKNAPAPPALCDEAKRKKPIRGGGNFESIMQAGMKMGGNKNNDAGDGSDGQGGMPDFVKQKLAAKNKVA